MSLSDSNSNSNFFQKCTSFKPCSLNHTFLIGCFLCCFRSLPAIPASDVIIPRFPHCTSTGTQGFGAGHEVKFHIFCMNYLTNI